MADEVPRRTVALAGLKARAEVIVDRWGVPHIYAASRHDVFFAQGWNAARDRLWQLDLWRRRGLGRLAESFGAAYAEQDRAARLFLYRGDLDEEWAAYGPDARTWSEAFVAGLNARVEQVLAGAAPLPVEFELTGAAPQRWDVHDLVRIRSHGLSNNAESEALRARIAAAGGLEADALRRRTEPADHAVRVPEGLDLSDWPDDLAADYILATKEVTFAPAAAPASEAELGALAETQGSNNWAVAASRTATGRPILASDPHRVLLAPSIRYLAHLDAPDLKIAGAGELHLPGVTIGHNEHAAFGITTFMIDQADYYVYDLNPQNPLQYRYDGAWEDMRVVEETVAVKGEAPRQVRLCFTRHGPVVKVQAHRHRAFALRSVWFEPGTASYFGAMRYQTARDWPAFKAALSHWGAAPMNFVYADVHGDIAWIPAGKAPKRPNWDGLLPVPGDGRYEWDGFASQEELPQMVNPPRGWVASANEFNLPEGHPSRGFNLGFEWADPGRINRIAEVLNAGGGDTVEGSARLQTDALSQTALRGAALLKGLTPADPVMARSMRLLEGWDGVEAVGSAAAAIAEVWLNKHLAPETARRIAPEAAAKVVAYGSPNGAISYLLRPGAALGEDAATARDAIVLASLASALAELAERLGPDMDRWRWGDLHHARLAPAVAALADPQTARRMTHGPAPLPGSAWTVWASTYRMEDFAAIQGASFRMVVDVGEWDNSLVINTPGQSGDPASPHYGDLFGLWASGAYVPMLWSRAAVEAAAEEVFELTP